VIEARARKPSRSVGTFHAVVLKVKVVLRLDGRPECIVVGEGMDSGQATTRRCVAFKYRASRSLHPDGGHAIPLKALALSRSRTHRPRPAAPQAPAPQVQKPCPRRPRSLRAGRSQLRGNEAGLTPKESTEAVNSVVDAFKSPRRGTRSTSRLGTFNRERRRASGGVAKRQAQEIEAEQVLMPPAECFEERKQC
jgi:hypothetical protein